MFQKFLLLIISVALVLVVQTTGAAFASTTHARSSNRSHSYRHPTPLQMKEWTWVGWCENHDHWTSSGTLYAGGLGITRANWQNYGGRTFAPSANLAKPWQQVVIAMKINKGYPVPDQPIGTCGGGW